jgi:hypothetical protein
MATEQIVMLTEKDRSLEVKAGPDPPIDQELIDKDLLYSGMKNHIDDINLGPVAGLDRGIEGIVITQAQAFQEKDLAMKAQVPDLVMKVPVWIQVLMKRPKNGIQI